MDYSKFFSKRSAKRKPDLIRQTTGLYMKNPNLIPLASGIPHASTFPFQEIDVTYKDGTRHRLTGRELEGALQYGPTDGHPPLLATWREFQNRWHSPPRDDWAITVTTGSQQASSMFLELILDVGDPMMVQVPAYTGTIATLNVLEPEVIGIQQDANGIVPELIEEICEARKREGLRLPKVLCVNPTGSNPTGAVLTEERRRKVYALAQKYDFLILEDDAYYFVNFLDYRPTSFLSLDTEGRVIRLDSFSKMLSSGMRIGIATAPKDIIAGIATHHANSTLHASTLSQVLVQKLLNSWGLDVFEKHLKEVQNFYMAKRDMMVSLAEKHLTGLAEWSVPQAGMFLWIKLTTVEDVLDMAMDKFVSSGVLVIPGHAFNYDASLPDQHIRLCYSYASPEQVDEGLSIIADLIRKKANKKSNQVHKHGQT